MARSKPRGSAKGKSRSGAKDGVEDVGSSKRPGVIIAIMTSKHGDSRNAPKKKAK